MALYLECLVSGSGSGGGTYTRAKASIFRTTNEAKLGELILYTCTHPFPKQQVPMDACPGQCIYIRMT